VNLCIVSLSAARTAVHHAALPSAERDGRACHPLTLKEQFIHSNPVESLQNGMRVSGDKICFFNNRRIHQARGMKTPAQAYKVGA
jgi:putative transposase